MKKIGLCVRYDCNNFGSMLQILATQKAIEDCGCKYEHIRYDKKTIAFFVKNLNRLFNPYFIRGKLMGFQKKKGLAFNEEVNQGNTKRNAMFRKYREEYIKPYSPIYKGYAHLAKGAEKYPAVMVGSDQLWTPAGLQSKFYNLLFVPDHIRKIALATSFGVTEIPRNQVEETKKYLDRIEFLSVREISGAKIVKELTGREALVAVDPALLYSGDEWLKIFPYKREYDEGYIFAYFLGASIEHRKIVESFAKRKGLKIVTCPAMDEFVEYDMTFGDYRDYEVGPVEFLNLIRGAEYVFTDSFHGSIFSILNHKQFMTFDRYSDAIRKGKNSRIESLFQLLELKKRHYDPEIYSHEILDDEINYADVEEKLGKLRDETWGFLRKTLNFKGEI